MPYQPTEVEKQAIADIYSRAIQMPSFGKFIEGLGLYEDEMATIRENPGARIDYLEEFLSDNSIRVRPDGLVEFWIADPRTLKLIGALPVVVYHYTSSAILPKIEREGLRADVKRINPDNNSGAGVYVTTECSGPAVEGYGRCAVGGHGNQSHSHVVCLTIKTHLRSLAPDPDDAGLSGGKHQFILPYVAPADILFDD